MAQDWDRETPWRQGHLLPHDAFGKLIPEQEAKGNDSAIVISHDCDLAASVEDEPKIELLLCRFVAVADGNYTASKNSRRLQIPLQNTNAKIVLDILVGSKFQLTKTALQSVRPEDKYLLTRDELLTLQRWLSDRYARSSFSNEFNNRLNQNKFKSKWSKIIEPLGVTLEAIYFDVDDNDRVTRVSGDPPFELVIYLRYSLGVDVDGYKKTSDAATKIDALFKKTFYDQVTQRWKDIQLKFCQPVSSDILPVSEHQKLRIWDSAYLSLRASPQQPVAKR